MRNSFLLPTYTAFLLLISLSGTARAQVQSSALTGTVTDEQGRTVPQAKVRAIEAATGLQRATETSSQGDYELLDLPPGTFSVQISKDGFSTFIAEHVQQVVGQTRTLNAKLYVAGTKQQTTVTESLVQLDKVDASVGAPIEQEQDQELPFNGRNWATM